jgi:dTDP-4-amino-4,6-dideoxygalactose transaminase
VLDGGSYILGGEVAAFERSFADYLGAGHAIGVNSGTDALHLALRVCGVGPGDAVVTVSHTAVATVAAIELAGAVPVLVDVDPETFTMDPNRLEDAIRYLRDSRGSAGRVNLKAVIPVHLYGQPADMPAIMAVAGRHGLYVIEDCAQSHGASLRGRKTGTWGELAAFSFYPTKNLGALGDGGALVTSDPALAEAARLLREYGWRERYVSSRPGMNTRLDELQAAVLRVKLGHLDEANDRRRQIARLYDALATDGRFVLPRARPDAVHVFHQYVVRTPARDALRAYLRERGVGTLIHYPVPVHLQPAYQGRVPEVGPLRRTEEIVRTVLSLPLYPELTEDQVNGVVQQLHAWEPPR